MSVCGVKDVYSVGSKYSQNKSKLRFRGYLANIKTVE